MNVLVTGGAGFIGTHAVRRLLREGCSVAVLDNFSSQIHGPYQELPPDLADHVQLYRADVRDRDKLCRALAHRDAILHLAAETGTGQSMYEILRYQDVNIGGTAAILDVIVNSPASRPKKLVVASSRAAYGEGKYRCLKHGIVYPGARELKSLRAGRFEPLCPLCETECTPEATDEGSPLHPLSFYGLTKKAQEEMALMLAPTHGVSVYALRYQNVYGPGQSLRNPYTGILAIFSNLVRSNCPIQIFEDGKESRDFVFVDDVVDATWRCLAEDSECADAFNVGSGQRITVLDVANEIVRYFRADVEILVTGAFRQGDIRHNFADLAKIKMRTGFAPETPFRDGLVRFLDWAATQNGVPSQYESSLRELSERGLFHG